MSASFESAIPVILKHEGGWVNDPNDLGAETNFGISTLMIKRMQKEDNLTDAQVEQMLGIKSGTLYTAGYLKTANGFTKNSASVLYKKYFWDNIGLTQILNQNIATKAMDIAVNCGWFHCSEMLQKAACAVGRQVDVDGRAGVKTFAAINGADASQYILALRDEQVKYYNKIAVDRPANAKFLPGWLKRAQWVDPTCW